MMETILILGGGYQSLSVSHSLQGYYRTVLLTNDKIALKGRCFDKKIKLPELKNESLRDYILGTILRENVSVVIPMSDVLAELLSYYKNEIENKTSAKCAVPNHDVFSKAADKSVLMDLCEKWNAPHPLTKIIKEGNENFSDFPYPALIKPNHSVGARGITLVHNFSEFKSKITSIEKEYGSCTLQEYIDNSDYYYNVMLYRDKNGDFCNTVITKITRFYPIKGGSSSFCKTINNLELERICKDVLTKLDWHGFADFDVLDKGNNEYKIIEINPRVPASLGAAEHSGVHFPMIIVADLLSKNIPHYEYKIGVSLRYLGLDIAWFLSSSKRFKCSPPWLKFFGRNLYYQEGGFRDRFAFMYSMFAGLEKYLKKKNK